MATASYDLFVSYAHTDDAVREDVREGWVTTLVGEVDMILGRMLGRRPDIWMDHELAGNANVSETLLETVRSSQTLLLVMSRGYQRSPWCQRELGNFLARPASGKGKDNVFVVVIDDRVVRESWHESLRSLKTIEFWHRPSDGKVARLLGYPVPKLDEEGLYWHKANELAHFIADYLERDPTTTAPSKPAILLAETTEDLLDRRESVAASLRQAGYEVLPGSDLPGTPRPSTSMLSGLISREFGSSLSCSACMKGASPREATRRSSPFKRAKPSRRESCRSKSFSGAHPRSSWIASPARLPRAFQVDMRRRRSRRV